MCSDMIKGMNRKTISERARIIQLLVEGNSMRSTSRIADCSISTVTKFLEDVGAACAEYQDRHLIHLLCTQIQVDEIWSFVYARKKNVTWGMLESGPCGDVWAWTAICPDTKLFACWHVGLRDRHSATEFISNLASRLKSRIQLTSDGFRPYRDAVESAFGPDIDFGMLVKQYGPGRGDVSGPYMGAFKESVTGKLNISLVTGCSKPSY